MMTSRRFALIALAALATLTALLTGCASTPPPPDWQTNAHGALKDFSSAHLMGNSRVANLEFARTKAEIASTGRLDLLARAEAVRCALRVASLELDNCAGFEAVAQDANAAERTYVAFLTGHWQDMNAAQTTAQPTPMALLPEHYRALVAAKDEPTRNAAYMSLSAPLSRLIAAGVLLQIGQITPEGVSMAVNTASDQGWRKPLLAWLGVQLKLTQASTEAHARIQRRIDLLSSDRVPQDATAKP